MVMQAHIAGSGGGGGKGGGSSPTEYPNSYRSTNRARLIEAVSEGRIGGLIEGPKSIYFDQTPLMNKIGTYNFKGITYEERVGLPDQAELTGNSAAETPFEVNTKLTFANGGVIRTINELNATAARVVIRIPALCASDDRGNIYPTGVRYTIERRVNNGGWVLIHDIHTIEKFTSPAQFAYRVDLPAGGAPWDLRVTRQQNDSTSTKLQDETYWDSYSTLVEGRFSYPNTALISLNVDASLFNTSSIPERKFRVDGLYVAVPSNYNPVTLAYSGIWNGTFKMEVTSNPAWIFYDLLVNDRYGLGEFIDANRIDKWSLYQIAQYCDQLVPDGYGGQEPRYTYRGQITNREEAFKVLQGITTCFRGMAFWSLGQVFAYADMPSDPVKLITPANVIDGKFNYSGTGLKARHSVCLVKWNDPQDFFRPATQVVIDDELLQKYGWRETSIQAEGCASRGLAQRMGRWLLDTEKNENETVEYNASWDQVNVRPGDIVAIADPSKQQTRAGGRIVSVVAKVVTLDMAFVPTPGQTYSLMAVLPNGDVETKPISTFAGAVVTLTTAFSQVPVAGALWVITGTDLQPRRFRVLQHVETEKNVFQFTALSHDPTKYARVEQGFTLEPIPYSRPKTTLAPPSNITAVETLYFNGGAPASRITLSWTQSADLIAERYIVTGTGPNGFQNFGQTTGTSLSIEATIPGEYNFEVAAVGVGGLVSYPTPFTFNALGWSKIDPPYVSHVEIFGRGTSKTFLGRDCRLVWRNNFPSSTVEINNEQYVGDGNNDPSFRDNVIDIYDDETDTLLRSDVLSIPAYTYTYERNVEDNALAGRGPSRRIRFDIRVRDTLGRTSAIERFIAENPVPDLIEPNLSSGYASIFVEYNRPQDLDFAGVKIWVSDVENFDPLSRDPDYVGHDKAINLPVEPEKDYYVRIAAFDTFGDTGLNISPSSSVYINAITGDEILEGTITGNHIAANTITGNKITANAITTNKLDVGAVTADKIAAGAITADKIAAGTITSNEIAADAITTSKLAAGAVTADEIAAGAVKASKLDVSTLSAITGNVGELTAGLIRGANPDALWMDLNSSYLRARNADIQGTLRATKMVAGSRLELGAGANIESGVLPFDIGTYKRGGEFFFSSSTSLNPNFTLKRDRLVSDALGERLHTPIMPYSHMLAYPASLDGGAGTSSLFITQDGGFALTGSISAWPGGAGNIGEVHQIYWDPGLRLNRQGNYWALGRPFYIQIPDGINTIEAWLWGGGGGTCWSGNDAGAGGFIRGYFPVSPGQRFILIVGFGGAAGDCRESDFTPSPLRFDLLKTLEGWAEAGRGEPGNLYHGTGGGRTCLGRIVDDAGNFEEIFVAGGGGAGHNGTNGTPGGPYNPGVTGGMPGANGQNTFGQGVGAGGGGGGSAMYGGGGTNGKGGSNYSHPSATSVSSQAGSGPNPPETLSGYYNHHCNGRMGFDNVNNKKQPGFGFAGGRRPNGPTVLGADGLNAGAPGFAWIGLWP